MKTAPERYGPIASPYRPGELTFNCALRYSAHRGFSGTDRQDQDGTHPQWVAAIMSPGVAVTPGQIQVGGLDMVEKARLRSDQGSRSASLNREQAVYDAKLSVWLSDHEGEFVVIKGEEVDGFYESRDEALAAGYSRFGIGPLFVKQVSSSEPVHHIPNALI